MKSSKLPNFLKSGKFITGMLILAFSIAATINAISYSSGITGYTSSTSQGCYCHYTGSNSNTSLSVNSSSGSFIVAPESETDFTVTVSNSQSSITEAGTNIAVKTTETGNTNAGTLSVASGSNLKIVSGEITQTQGHNLSGNEAGFGFTWTAPSTPGIYYLRAIGNAVNGNGGADSGDQWNRMQVQTLTVYGVTVSAPTGSEVLCPGASLAVNWTSYGATNVKIELSSNGGTDYTTVLADNIAASAETWTWNIPNDFSPGTQYKIRVVDTQNNNITGESSGTFTISAPTAITEQPANKEVCTGQSVSFSVVATGNELTYQWKKDGTNINGATQATYQISSVSSNSAGSYSCVVSGACGEDITSNSATLTVNISPVISQNPTDVTVCPEESVTFTVLAEADGIEYQWRKNGNNIDGANSASYTIENVSSADAGVYNVIITGDCPNSAESTGAILAVNEPPQIITDLSDTEFCQGESAELSIQASGTGLMYQWYKNGNSISNQSTNTLSFSSVSNEDAGTYKVVIIGACLPELTSNEATIFVNPLPSITEHPKSQSTIEGTEITLSIEASGDNLEYQWRFNEVDIQGATSQSYTIQSVALSDAGIYDCVVTNSCGEVISNSAEISVAPAGAGPVIELSSSNINFGVAIIEQQQSIENSITLSNSGDEVLEITNISISGANSAEFTYSSVTLPVTLAHDEELELTIEFTAQGEGNRTASLEFESNALNNPKLNLMGFGGVFDISTSTNLIDFGDVEANSSENETRTLTIFNNSNFNVNAPSIELEGDITAFTIVSQLPTSFDTNSEVELEFGFVAKEVGEYSLTLKLTFEYSDTPIELTLTGKVTPVSVIENKNITMKFNIYPNPSNSSLNLNIETDFAHPFNLFIIDKLGNHVMNFDNVYAQGGSVNIDWDGTDSRGNSISSGTYYLLIQADGLNESFPIVIQK